MSAILNRGGDDTPLYDAMAASYDYSIEQPSARRAYDRLCQDYVRALGLGPGVRVVDVGCGTGRWAEWLLAQGCTVTGIERAPGMVATLRSRALGPDFRLLEQAMEDAAIAPGSVDLVLAIGSLQYAVDPAAMLRRMAAWACPGGTVAVLVDSLVALVVELLRDGREAEAAERLATRRGLFRFGDHAAPLHLYDCASLERDMAAAGLAELRFHGLAAGATAIGRPALGRRMREDEAATLAAERALADHPAMADCGLHLLGIGRVPAVPRPVPAP
ncbi:MAG: class I SAM-dependent methyltransferase [Gluconacetobacter diazotrophicus]|nr:class I SAM-dependent methyltransferase [Gluconacetobacter diazotrophicus]